MSLNTPSIFRLIVPVSDPEDAVAFYCELLGIEGRAVGGGRTYFDCGGVILALLQGNTPLPDYIYFSVGDLEAVFERSKSLDCLSKADVHGEPAGEIVVRPWRERSFYVSDPWRNGLCFVDEKTIFTGRR